MKFNFFSKKKINTMLPRKKDQVRQLQAKIVSMQNDTHIYIYVCVKEREEERNKQRERE